MSPVVKGLKGMVWIRRDDDVYHLSSKEKCDLYIYMYIYIFGKTICWDLFFTENTSTLSSSRPLTRAMNSIKMMKMYVNFQKWNQTFVKYNFADKLIACLYQNNADPLSVHVTNSDFIDSTPVSFSVQCAERCFRYLANSFFSTFFKYRDVFKE